MQGIAAFLRRCFARPRNADTTTRRRPEAAFSAILEARKAHSRLRDAIDILPHGLVFLDAENRYILWNQQYTDIYKRSADLFQPGAKLVDTLRIGVERGDYPEAAGREEEWMKERLHKLFHPDGRHEQTLSDGRTILIEERRTSDGGIIGLRVDITEMKQREASFRLLFDGNPVPMIVYGRDSRSILAVNDAAVQHYGYSRGQMLTMSLLDIHHPDEPRTRPSRRHAVRGSRWPHLEASQGRWRHDRRRDLLQPPHLWRTRQRATLIAAIDITERKAAESRVEYMAHHDALTSLPNRILLRLRMEDMIAGLRRGGSGFAVFCVDLDNFKWVNDTLGHPLGDLLLQGVAEPRHARIELRDDDTIARLGGDEFTILQADVDRKPEEVGDLLSVRLLAVIGEPFDLEGHMVTVGASIGIAHGAERAATIPTIPAA